MVFIMISNLILKDKVNQELDVRLPEKKFINILVKLILLEVSYYFP